MFFDSLMFLINALAHFLMGHAHYAILATGPIGFLMRDKDGDGGDGGQDDADPGDGDGDDAVDSSDDGDDAAVPLEGDGDDSGDDDDKQLGVREWWEKKYPDDEFPEGIETPEDLIEHLRKSKKGGDDHRDSSTMTREELAAVLKEALGGSHRADGGGDGADEIIGQIDIETEISNALKSGLIKGDKDVSAQDVAAEYADFGRILIGPINKKLQAAENIIFALVTSNHDLRERETLFLSTLTTGALNQFVERYPDFARYSKDLQEIKDSSPRVKTYLDAAKILALDKPHLLPKLMPKRDRMGGKDGKRRDKGGDDRGNGGGGRLAFLTGGGRNRGVGDGSFDWKPYMTPAFLPNDKKLDADFAAKKISEKQRDLVYDRILKTRKEKGLT
jgi:hypothetical protein